MRNEIAQFDEVSLYAFGLDRVTVQTLRNIVRIVGTATNSVTLPDVAAQVESGGAFDDGAIAAPAAFHARIADLEAKIEALAELQLAEVYKALEASGVERAAANGPAAQLSAEVQDLARLIALMPDQSAALAEVRNMLGTMATQDANAVAITGGTISGVTITGVELTANKDVSGGYAGLTLYKLNLKNAAGTITNWFTTAATAVRTWTMPNASGTVALTSDITGTNSGVNTGDQTLASLGAAAVAGSSAQAFAASALSFTSISGGIGKVGSLVRTSGSASGNVAYTGVGFMPSAILFFCAIDTVAEACWGFATAAAGRNMYSDTANNKTSTATAIHFIRSTDTQDATIASMDADGFTLAWTRVGTGATANDIVVNYLALR